jgi:hypothetical protein
MTTQEIKQRLKSRLRQRVPHPDGHNRFVRITEANRTGVTYNDGDKSVSLRWEDLTSEQAGQMLSEKPPQP